MLNMFKKIRQLGNIIKDPNRNSIQRSLAPYEEKLRLINMIDLSGQSDVALKSMSQELRSRSLSGVPAGTLLPEAYSLVREAACRTLGMRPFDVQVLAAAAMDDCRMVEMQTGEGKTLSAVMPAYLNSLTGRGVHVLTFNDYLARRDRTWMDPIYEFLGISTAYVCEGMPKDMRKAAYACDVTYLTAKEAGFDYLRGCLENDSSGFVQRAYNFAIIDEADSIMIDEARVPLVIAGSAEEEEELPARIAEMIYGFKKGVDYDTDEYSRSVHLTDVGTDRAERMLGCGNLYETRNIGILTMVNNALHANILLARDVDYIVREGRIELVDEFTGRIADKRHWPDGIQIAVEAKEGLKPKSKGRILDTVTMQNFIRLYPRFCGMTGTACTSSEEFLEFYGIKTVMIPTNRPCIRIDHDDWVYTHKEAKMQALVEEISSVHSAGRPVLVGTVSIEESEELSGRLAEAGVPCNVLNAKNDEHEAGIIANAGLPGAVTVSTNMAGRGTDIKLGGEFEEKRDEVVALGGLYVIGTNRHESRRIDNQLRGRAGRQGDPGQSRFFTSLEDNLMIKYRIMDSIPLKFRPGKQRERMEDPRLAGIIRHIQRVVEGQNFDIRKMLEKYSLLTEQQRSIIHNKRRKLITGEEMPYLLAKEAKERYDRLCAQFGEKAVRKAEAQITLYHLNRNWTDYLEYTSYVRESIHLASVGGKNPLDEFNMATIKAFDIMIGETDEQIVESFYRVTVTGDGIDLEKEGMKGPSATWTYLVSDGTETFGNPMLANPVAAALSLPMYLGLAVYQAASKKKKILD